MQLPIDPRVDRHRAAGLLPRGIAYYLGRQIVRGALDPQEAAEALAYGAALDDGEGPPTIEEGRRAREPHTRKAIERIDAARRHREADRARLGTGPTPLKYVIVATGNIYDDADQARAAAQGGADIVAVIRSTAQSLLDYVPVGATTQGPGGAR